MKPFGFLSVRQQLKFIPVKAWDGKRFHAPYMDPQAIYPELFAEYEERREEYAYDLLKRDQAERSTDIKLSAREVEYLHLFLIGHSISQVAKELGVSTTAVDKMKRKLRQKKALGPVEV